MSSRLLSAASPKFALRAANVGRRPSGFPFGAAALAATLLVGASAYANHQLAKRAERRNPPKGRFIEVDGVKLHVVEQGQGEPLVLLHGNGSMIEDFASSGLIDLAASKYRVIAIDRPGFGHSARPRDRLWTDAAQAELIEKALIELGVSRALVLGHSWGCSVAVALALNHPETTSALILVSGYYYPTLRADAFASSALSIPIIGDVLRYTLSPMLARATWPLILRKLFGPASPPRKFAGFPQEMALRPSQLGASAADSALMVPDAAARAKRYRELTTPIVIIAGEEDQLVSSRQQSARLHAEAPHSTLHLIAGAGHMVHQTATEDVFAAIDEAAKLAGGGAAGHVGAPSLQRETT